jgi:hypothetical protein
VSGCNHTNVHGNRTCASHPFNLPVLQDPQEPNLGLKREIAYLIEKDGAAVGPLEATALGSHRTGKGSLFVSE